MKNLNLFALVASLTLVFSSCSTNENLLEEEQSLDLLKSYTIKRDASGAYSLDYNLNGNAEADNVKDLKTNTNEIYLYSSDNQTNRSVSQDLSLDGDQFKVGFVDTNSDKKQPKITVIDDNIVFAKDTDQDMLAEYSITSNQDGTYSLDFKVEDKVEVDFIYNNEDSVYEIHLEKGNGNESSFERTFTKDEGSDLKIDFVNHTANTNSRIEAPKKPRLIIDSFN